MRKTLAVVLTAVLLAGLASGADAAKKKKKKKKTVEGSVELILLPYPPSQADGDCESGVEDVHVHHEPFTTPGAGQLTLDLSGYSFDWDLFLMSNGSILASDVTFNTGTPATPGLAQIFFNLPKGADVEFTACNFAGLPAPPATLHWKYVYTA